jgi:hypothetical protein
MKKSDLPFLRFLNSIKIEPPDTLVNQHSSLPLPLPILIPLGFLVNGRWGNAKNQENRLVLSDFFTAFFKNSLNLNIWEADKCTGLSIIRPDPPKFNFFFR